jgi:hypothetical protein
VAGAVKCEMKNQSMRAISHSLQSSEEYIGEIKVSFNTDNQRKRNSKSGNSEIAKM